MTTRILLAGVLGGVAMFIWTSIAHTVLPLGQTGVRELPNESTVLAALKDNIGETRGLFIYPGSGLKPDATREEKSAAMKQMGEKIAQNPSGLLMYHPPGRPLNLGRLLGVEFLTELAEALLIVFLLAQTQIESFSGRFGFIFVGGILAAISTNVSYWNWYGFPKRYTAAYMLIQIVGFAVVGIMAALVVGKRSTRTT